MMLIVEFIRIINHSINTVIRAILIKRVFDSVVVKFLSQQSYFKKNQQQQAQRDFLIIIITHTPTLRESYSRQEELIVNDYNVSHIE
jgi:uncharacterized membrane protein YkvI